MSIGAESTDQACRIRTKPPTQNKECKRRKKDDLLEKQDNSDSRLREGQAAAPEQEAKRPTRPGTHNTPLAARNLQERRK